MEATIHIDYVIKLYMKHLLFIHHSLKTQRIIRTAKTRFPLLLPHTAKPLPSIWSLSWEIQRKSPSSRPLAF